MKDVMIDIKTLETEPGSVVISIGAVFFNPKTGELGAEFYETIDWQSCIDLGCTMSADTIKWLLQQSDDARKAILNSGDDLDIVLGNFCEWLKNFSTGDIKPWGNGATFDITLIEDLYRKCDIDIPWKFWNVRDCRTVEDLAYGHISKKNIVREGTHHNALDDAIYQAKYISAMWSYFI